MNHLRAQLPSVQWTVARHAKHDALLSITADPEGDEEIRVHLLDVHPRSSYSATKEMVRALDEEFPDLPVLVMAHPAEARGSIEQRVGKDGVLVVRQISEDSHLWALTEAELRNVFAFTVDEHAEFPMVTAGIPTEAFATMFSASLNATIGNTDGPELAPFSLGVSERAFFFSVSKPTPIAEPRQSTSIVPAIRCAA